MDILETLEEIESIIEEVLPETTENYTIGTYDDLPAVPYFLPEVETDSNGEIIFYDNAMKYLDDISADGNINGVNVLYACYLQSKTISMQLTSIMVLVVAVLAAVLIGSAFHR